mmetsp:Transcript_223/g.555  ORF Transcript_223/g.555 Transcript_223/m.555 type:complete len:84 (-) Transcript_223:72-323(-)
MKRLYTHHCKSPRESDVSTSPLCLLPSPCLSKTEESKRRQRGTLSDKRQKAAKLNRHPFLAGKYPLMFWVLLQVEKENVPEAP